MSPTHDEELVQKEQGARGGRTQSVEEKGETERAPRRKLFGGGEGKEGWLENCCPREGSVFRPLGGRFWSWEYRSRVERRSRVTWAGAQVLRTLARESLRRKTEPAKAIGGSQKFRDRAPPKTTPLPEHAFFKARGGGF